MTVSHVVGYLQLGVPTINNQEKQNRYPQTIQSKIANETPRPRSDSYEARSTGSHDYVPTRTRHAQRDASTTFRLV
jgi:hypothetical protein